MNTHCLYQTAHGSIWQHDHLGTIEVRFATWEVQFKVHNFLHFKQVVDRIDIQSCLFDLDDAVDNLWLDAPNGNQKFRLTLCEVIHLKDLLEGAAFSLYVYQTLFDLWGEVAILPE